MVTYVERTQIYLSAEQQRQLERRALASGRTKSDLIREALNMYLQQEPSAEEWRRQWLEAVDAVAGIAPYLPEGAVDAEELRRADLKKQQDLERRRR
jgi:predicted transcriptional regulator